eukprot:comp17430_c0_seq1/m.16832 comp17430_c0_seq1/g.16832  ORF comp17430_c0_seq1/g.16832 comp17430_c0_seq1/m.16832 type:complete len:362 (-) comp17430_c0_seq1:287-1372(-)
MSKHNTGGRAKGAPTGKDSTQTRNPEADEALEQEVQALEAIYGEEWKPAENDQQDGNRVFVYSLRPQPPDELNGEEVDVDALDVRFMLPNGYPLTSLPLYELGAASWWRAEDEEEAMVFLDSLLAEANGEPVLFQCVEWLREKVSTSPTVSEYFSDLLEDSRQRQAAALATETARKLRLQELSQTQNSEQEARENGDGGSPNLPRAFVASKALGNGPPVTSGDPFTIKKSTFQAHVAPVHSVADVKSVLAHLYQNTKIARATHNMYAYRIYDEGKGCWLCDCDDDGEAQAGGRLAHLLDIQGVRNVMVVVSRWYGGILLGPDRFKHINNVARLILVETGYVEEGGDAHGDGEKKKGAKKHK